MPLRGGLTLEEREELLANMDRLLVLYAALEDALKTRNIAAVSNLKSEAEMLRVRNAEIKTWITRGSA